MERKYFQYCTHLLWTAPFREKKKSKKNQNQNDWCCDNYNKTVRSVWGIDLFPEKISLANVP